RGRARLVAETPEAMQVEVRRAELEDVSRRPGLDEGRAERLAELRDVHLQRLRRGVGRPLTPQPVDQAVARYHLVRVRKEDGEQRTLLRPAQRHGSVRCRDLQGPQD